MVLGKRNKSSVTITGVGRLTSFCIFKLGLLRPIEGVLGVLGVLGSGV